MEEREHSLWELIIKQETILDLRKLVESYLIDVCRLIGEKRSGKSKNVIERIRSVMDKRYSENLLVDDIAKEVYLTSTYICLLFKQETGVTINEYLTSVRIKQAKELLKDPPACEICGPTPSWVPSLGVSV
ncbi:helix-turn-helix transcriptional regulator [Paenibacillus psychroresistens]|nr:AraC family transcriptional regulator [Paenibacillus psychroresistens]